MTSQNTNAALNVKQNENLISSLTRLIKNGLSAEDELNASSELFVRSVNLRKAKQVAHYTDREFSSYRQLTNHCNYSHVEAMELVEAHSEEINDVEPCNISWARK